MVESPCVACCRLNADKLCVGCYRHISEIVDWNRRTDEQNAAILQKVAKRKQQAELTDISMADTSPITQAEWLAAKQAARTS
ncbi:MAG: DUF1289 domain-containing protein [Gammaproteobacteria bacterium]|nr:DUF1289 domain-containing protein [Gammaproteobacteria bacterium]MBU2182290.1 DUF1289 domain-containing protein [Gammaproteobacteria bacterium]MBU2206628.1 DUF1289 domain-containing protein [Gammaproteobacteria bacterium]